ncbi:MAG: DUF3387 domain-containing protein [Methanothrix sp.]|nr:type I restriction enzyme endonuclease domain-containing protein [Methanothrix sp.]MCX8207202.1 DUF3387 domain-containing protein [Methanothrix sp.]
MEQEVNRNPLAVELLRKLISGEIKERRRRNVVRARSFAGMLDRSLKRYHNRAIDAVQIIEEPIDIARRMREDEMRGKALGLHR